ncbi:MAG: SIR2 family NAD-dependent protein deacylase [Flavobacteriales bacterium]
MQKIVVLSGAGISAESGISTFRDNNGLWENHKIEDVATPEAWEMNRELVVKFYNMRRKQLFEVEPNDGHRALVKLEEKFDVQIITQNVDDLHERAGSSNVLHLHGELKKVQSTLDSSLLYTMEDWELKVGDTCEKGGQLRPHIVWFGEEVPNILPAADMVSKADCLIVVGTSLNVYPAAGLIHEARQNIPIYLVDPSDVDTGFLKGVQIIQTNAGEGLTSLVNELLENNKK